MLATVAGVACVGAPRGVLYAVVWLFVGSCAISWLSAGAGTLSAGPRASSTSSSVSRSLEADDDMTSAVR